MHHVANCATAAYRYRYSYIETDRYIYRPNPQLNNRWECSKSLIGLFQTSPKISGFCSEMSKLTWVSTSRFVPLPSLYILKDLFCMRQITNEPGKPTASYRWASWVWEITGWGSRLHEFARHFGGIYGIDLTLIKENWEITTCNWLGLETLGSWLILPKYHLETDPDCINSVALWMRGNYRHSYRWLRSIDTWRQRKDIGKNLLYKDGFHRYPLIRL